MSGTANTEAFTGLSNTFRPTTESQRQGDICGLSCPVHASTAHILRFGKSRTGHDVYVVSTSSDNKLEGIATMDTAFSVDQAADTFLLAVKNLASADATAGLTKRCPITSILEYLNGEVSTLFHSGIDIRKFDRANSYEQEMRADGSGLDMAGLGEQKSHRSRISRSSAVAESGKVCRRLGKPSTW